MKLSAFLAVSVPIVAASQLPAVAADENTGTWVQSSIASFSTVKPLKAAPAKRMGHATPVASTVNLRPFKPGRYLPSETELRRAALVAQQAQMDYSANPNAMYANGGSLNGRVQQAYAAPRAMSAYDQYAMSNAPVAAYSQMPKVRPQKKAIGTRAPRVVPNQQPMLPEQLAQHASIQPLIPEPPVQRQVKAPFPVSMPIAPFPQPPAQNMMQQQQMQMSMQQQQQQMMMQQQQMMQMRQMQMQQQQQMMPMQQQQAMQNNNFQSDFSQEELTDLYRRMEQAKPTARMNFNGDVVGQAMDNPGNGIGQPPFPLNLFGGSALQQIAHRNPKPNVAPARFGSWHGNGGLAEAGFHTYVARRKPMMYDYTRAPLPSAVKKKVNKRPSSFSAAPQVAHVAPKPKPVIVATYPAYTSRGAY